MSIYRIRIDAIAEVEAFTQTQDGTERTQGAAARANVGRIMSHTVPPLLAPIGVHVHSIAVLDDADGAPDQ